MRLDEIVSENMLIIKLHNISISYETEFNSIIVDLNMFLKLKGPRLQRYIDYNLSEFIKLLHEFIEIQFYDESDSDIIRIKDRCKEMISIIDNKIKTGR